MYTHILFLEKTSFYVISQLHMRNQVRIYLVVFTRKIHFFNFIKDRISLYQSLTSATDVSFILNSKLLYIVQYTYEFIYVYILLLLSRFQLTCSNFESSIKSYLHNFQIQNVSLHISLDNIIFQ